MDERVGPGSHRTRSKAAPEWSLEESLTLVNEIAAVESEWGPTLPSFQKWQQIVENCNALDVSRNLNQCKRHWDHLLGLYERVRVGNGSLPVELFKTIDQCVRKKGGGAQVESEEEEDEGKAGTGTEPESDPDAQGRVGKLVFETVLKKQRHRMKRSKRRFKRLTPWGYFTNPNINREESSSIREKAGETNKNIVESAPSTSMGVAEKTMAAILWENALQINRILEGSLVDDGHYRLADLENMEAVQTDFARRQGDKIIDCLGKISGTLNQLCDFYQQCN